VYLQNIGKRCWRVWWACRVLRRSGYSSHVKLGVSGGEVLEPEGRRGARLVYVSARVTGANTNPGQHLSGLGVGILAEGGVDFCRGAARVS